MQSCGRLRQNMNYFPIEPVANHVDINELLLGSPTVKYDVRT